MLADVMMVEGGLEGRRESRAKKATALYTVTGERAGAAPAPTLPPFKLAVGEKGDGGGCDCDDSDGCCCCTDEGDPDTTPEDADDAAAPAAPDDDLDEDGRNGGGGGEGTKNSEWKLFHVPLIIAIMRKDKEFEMKQWS